jgi:hypothetical protein
MAMHASTKIKNCVHAIKFSQQLSSVVVWIACLLAGWLADKQIAERNKLLFLTLQQLDYIFIFIFFFSIISIIMSSSSSSSSSSAQISSSCPFGCSKISQLFCLAANLGGNFFDV